MPAENFYGCSEELALPQFCYAFGTGGCGQRLGLGFAAERGERNCHAFDYRGTKKARPYPWTGFGSRRDTMRRLLNQSQAGVPALYAVTSSERRGMDDEDFRAAVQVWREYNPRIDAMYAVGIPVEKRH